MPILYAKMLPAKDQDVYVIELPIFTDKNQSPQTLPFSVNKDSSIPFCSILIIGAKCTHGSWVLGLREQFTLQNEFQTVNQYDVYRNSYICALAVNQETYDRIQNAKNYSSYVRNTFCDQVAFKDRQYSYSLQADEFEIIGIICWEQIKSNLNFNFILNDSRKTDELTKQLENDFAELKTLCFYSKDRSPHAIHFERSSAFIHYMLGKSYNDPATDKHDPALALYYFEVAGEYLPALKEMLPIYIAESFNEDGSLDNPEAYEYARRTATSILKLEPDNYDAKSFFDRENNFKSSIAINKQFYTLMGHSVRSMTLFNNRILPKMHIDTLCELKAIRDEKYKTMREHAQNELDHICGIQLRK